MLAQTTGHTVRLLSGIALTVVICQAAAGQSHSRGQILLPNTSYSAGEIAESPDGVWQMLKMGADGTYATVDAEVTSHRVEDYCLDDEGEATAIDVRVPETAAVLLMRGINGLTSGPIETAVWKPEQAYSGNDVELGWSTAVFRIRSIPVGDGRRIVLTGPSYSQTIYSTEWEDEGSWMLRWAGDLNGDGALDLILDATHKYSVSATRLYLSTVGPDGARLEEVASLTTYAC